MAGLRTLSVLRGRQLRVLGQDSAPALGESEKGGILCGPQRRDKRAQICESMSHSLAARPTPNWLTLEVEIRHELKTDQS